jgi:hypothetical protein
MKLCPQCDFIYEDDQGFCDMDGKELVYNPAPGDIQPNIADSLNPTPEILAAPQPPGLAAAVVVVVVLTALVVALYLVRRHQTRSGAASEASTQLPERSAGQRPAQSALDDASAQPSASDLVSTQTSASPELPTESSSSQTEAQSLTPSAPATSKPSLAHTRLAAGSVSAAAPSGKSRNSVIVRVNNGAVIKADEAWEKKEGIWYRQAGMVTFLKRSQVKSIERSATPAAPSKSVANSADDKNKKNTATQNQLRLAQLEPVDTKKPSRLSSFLKKAGRILKKPFKQ